LRAERNAQFAALAWCRLARPLYDPATIATPMSRLGDDPNLAARTEENSRLKAVYELLLEPLANVTVAFGEAQTERDRVSSLFADTSRLLAEAEAHRDRLMVEVEVHRERLRVETERLRVETERLSSEISALKARLRQTESTLAGVYSSRSWRATAPMRRASQTAGRIGASCRRLGTAARLLPARAARFFLNRTLDLLTFLASALISRRIARRMKRLEQRVPPLRHGEPPVPWSEVGRIATLPARQGDAGSPRSEGEDQVQGEATVSAGSSRDPL